MISLELMSEENSIDVYSFEKENREYFERNLPPSVTFHRRLTTFVKFNHFGLVLLYKKSRQMSTRNVEFWQTTGNDDAIDSLSQIPPYESTR